MCEVDNYRSVTQRRKTSQTHINTNHLWAERNAGGSYLDGKNRKPTTRLSFNRECFNRAVEWAVQSNSYAPNPGKPKLVVIQCVPDSPERNAVIARCGSVAGVARLLSTAYPSEKSLKRKMDTLERALKYRRTHSGNVRTELSYFCELKILIKPRDGFTFTLPRFASFLNGRIVQLGAYYQHFTKSFCLMFRWVNSVSERLDHVGYFTTSQWSDHAIILAYTNRPTPLEQP